MSLTHGLFGLGWMHPVSRIPSSIMVATLWKGDPAVGAESVALTTGNARRYTIPTITVSSSEIVTMYDPNMTGSQAHASGANVVSEGDVHIVDFTSETDRDNYDSDAAYVTVDNDTTGYVVNLKQFDE